MANSAIPHTPHLYGASDPFGLPLLDPLKFIWLFGFYISQYFQVLQVINFYQFLIWTSLIGADDEYESAIPL
jgi:hypothetical protein